MPSITAMASQEIQSCSYAGEVGDLLSRNKVNLEVRPISDKFHGRDMKADMANMQAAANGKEAGFEVRHRTLGPCYRESTACCLVWRFFPFI
jgi:hypothetical protein